MSEGIEKKLLCLAILAGSLGVARGGTIVNINALQNGENAGNQSCSITCNGSLLDPVQVTFGPGTYQLNDAWSSSSGLEAGALYDAWNFQAGNPTAWAWHWKVLFDDGSDGSTVNPSNYSSLLIADVDPTQAFSTELAAANFGASTTPTVITLSQTTTLDFIVNDNELGDNAGGVSLDVACTSGACLGGTAPSTPEPSTFMLLASGLAALGSLMLRRSTKV